MKSSAKGLICLVSNNHTAFHGVQLGDEEIEARDDAILCFNMIVSG